jgi:uncharacterized metal-binding protein
MNKNKQMVVVVPCSGIGKAYGSVAREAGYVVCEDLRPDRTQLVALSKLVLGEESSRALVGQYPAVTIDGCKMACAAKLVKLNGGTTAQEVAVLDALKANRQLKPEGIAELNPEGKELARVIGADIAKVVDELTSCNTHKNGGKNA